MNGAKWTMAILAVTTWLLGIRPLRADPLIVNAGDTYTVAANTTLTISGSATVNGTLKINGNVVLPDNGIIDGVGTITCSFMLNRGSQLSASSGTTTIGAGLTLNGSTGNPSYGALNTYVGNPTAPLVNFGHVVANQFGFGNLLAIRGSTIENYGFLEARDGGVLGIDTNFTMASLGSIDYHSGAIQIMRSLDNTGQTLQIDNAHGGVYTGNQAEFGPPVIISGGTINTGDGQALRITADSECELDGVVFNGNIRALGKLLVPAGQSLQGNIDVLIPDPMYLEDVGGVAAASGSTDIGSSVNIHGGTTLPPSTFTYPSGWFPGSIGNDGESLTIEGAVRADRTGIGLSPSQPLYLYIRGNDITNSGTLEADSGATLVATGPTTFLAGSHFVTGGGSLTVAGNLSLISPTDYLNVLPLADGSAYDGQVILTYTGTCTGFFNRVTTGIQVTYDAANKRIEIFGTPIPEPASWPPVAIALAWLSVTRRPRFFAQN